MSEIEKLSEEKHLLLQEKSQLEQNIQKSSNYFIYVSFKAGSHGTWSV